MENYIQNLEFQNYLALNDPTVYLQENIEIVQTNQTTARSDLSQNPQARTIFSNVMKIATIKKDIIKNKRVRVGTISNEMTYPYSIQSVISIIKSQKEKSNGQQQPQQPQQQQQQQNIRTREDEIQQEYESNRVASDLFINKIKDIINSRKGDNLKSTNDILQMIYASVSTKEGLVTFVKKLSEYITSSSNIPQDRSPRVIKSYYETIDKVNSFMVNMYYLDKDGYKEHFINKNDTFTAIKTLSPEKEASFIIQLLGIKRNCGMSGEDLNRMLKLFREYYVRKLPSNETVKLIRTFYKKLVSNDIYVDGVPLLDMDRSKITKQAGISINFSESVKEMFKLAFTNFYVRLRKSLKPNDPSIQNKKGYNIWNDIYLVFKKFIIQSPLGVLLRLSLDGSPGRWGGFTVAGFNFYGVLKYLLPPGSRTFFTRLLLYCGKEELVKEKMNFLRQQINDCLVGNVNIYSNDEILIFSRPTQNPPNSQSQQPQSQQNAVHHQPQYNHNRQLDNNQFYLHPQHYFDQANFINNQSDITPISSQSDFNFSSNPDNQFGNAHSIDQQQTNQTTTTPPHHYCNLCKTMLPNNVTAHLLVDNVPICTILSADIKAMLNCVFSCEVSRNKILQLLPGNTWEQICDKFEKVYPTLFPSREHPCFNCDIHFKDFKSLEIFNSPIFKAIFDESKFETVHSSFTDYKIIVFICTLHLEQRMTEKLFVITGRISKELKKKIEAHAEAKTIPPVYIDKTADDWAKIRQLKLRECKLFNHHFDEFLDKSQDLGPMIVWSLYYDILAVLRKSSKEISSLTDKDFKEIKHLVVLFIFCHVSVFGIESNIWYFEELTHLITILKLSQQLNISPNELNGQAVEASHIDSVSEQDLTNQHGDSVVQMMESFQLYKKIMLDIFQLSNFTVSFAEWSRKKGIVENHENNIDIFFELFLEYVKQFEPDFLQRMLNDQLSKPIEIIVDKENYPAIKNFFSKSVILPESSFQLKIARLLKNAITKFKIDSSFFNLPNGYSQLMDNVDDNINNNNNNNNINNINHINNNINHNNNEYQVIKCPQFKIIKEYFTPSNLDSDNFKKFDEFIETYFSQEHLLYSIKIVNTGTKTWKKVIIDLRKLYNDNHTKPIIFIVIKSNSKSFGQRYLIIIPEYNLLDSNQDLGENIFTTTDHFRLIMPRDNTQFSKVFVSDKDNPKSKNTIKYRTSSHDQTIDYWPGILFLIYYLRSLTITIQNNSQDSIETPRNQVTDIILKHYEIFKKLIEVKIGNSNDLNLFYFLIDTVDLDTNESNQTNLKQYLFDTIQNSLPASVPTTNQLNFMHSENNPFKISPKIIFDFVMGHWCDVFDNNLKHIPLDQFMSNFFNNQIDKIYIGYERDQSFKIQTDYLVMKSQKRANLIPRKISTTTTATTTTTTTISPSITNTAQTTMSQIQPLLSTDQMFEQENLLFD